MISATDLRIQAGSEILVEVSELRIARGDRIGLVGRNGAGKTTLTRVLAGERIPEHGVVRATGSVGYLPQDPRAADPNVSASDRVLSARGLNEAMHRMREATLLMDDPDPDRRERAFRRYSTAEEEFLLRGGYAAESEAALLRCEALGGGRWWPRCPTPR